MSTFRRDITHSRKLDLGASAQQPPEPGPAAVPSLYNSPLPPGNPPQFQKILEDYLRRFRPSDFVENNLVRHLAFIEWRIRRITSCRMAPGFLLDMPASHFRYYTSLISTRSAVFRTLCRLASGPRRHERTQKWNQISHLDPGDDPAANPVGLRANPSSDSNEPGSRACVPPTSPLRLD